MNNTIQYLEEQINILKSLQQRLIQQEIELKNHKMAGKIDDLTDFGRLLNDKRKQLGIDLQTLELQTGISLSTLNRLFQDPSQVRFSTVLRVANTLGVNLCTL